MADGTESQITVRNIGERNELRIGELARRCNVTAKTLRLYEARGLIAPLGRDAIGYRQYAAGLVQEVRLITMMLSLGLHLDEVGTVLAPHSPIRDAVDVATTRERMRRSTSSFERHIEAIEHEVAILQARREALRFRIRHCQAFLASELAVTPLAPRVSRRSSLPGRVAYEYECQDCDADPVRNRAHHEF